MSRYKDWTNAWSGIATWLMNFDKKLNADKEINNYSKALKLKGSFSERCLLISENFNQFKNYIKQNHERNT